jgi:hypothetical protein
MALERRQRITEVVKREKPRRPGFIRRRVPDARDAEDIFARLARAAAERDAPA